MDSIVTDHKDYHPHVRRVRAKTLIAELQGALRKKYTHVQYGGSHCSIGVAINKIREEFGDNDLVQVIAQNKIIPAVHVYG